MSLSRLEQDHLTFYVRVTNIMDSSDIIDEVESIRSSELEEIPGSEENLKAVMIRRILGDGKKEIAEDLGLTEGSVGTYTSNLTRAGYLENTGDESNSEYKPGLEVSLDILEPSSPLESEYPFILQPMIVVDRLSYGEERTYNDDISENPEWFSKLDSIEQEDNLSETENPSNLPDNSDESSEENYEKGVEVKSVNPDSIILEGGLAITGNGRLPQVKQGDLVEVEETGESYMNGGFDKVEYIGKVE